MRTTSIQFTGKMLIQGSDDELSKINDNIRGKSFKNSFEKNFEFQDIVHDMGLKQNTKINLYTTKKDAMDLRNYFEAQKIILNDSKMTVAMKEYNQGNQPQWDNLLTSRKNFYRANIPQYIEIPEILHKATDILKAISNNLFDFENLRLIKK